MSQWIYLQQKKPMHPSPAGFIIMRTFVYNLKEIIGESVGEWAFIYEDGVMTAYANRIQEKAMQAGFQYIKQNPKRAAEIRRKFETLSKTFLNYTSNLKKENLRKISNQRIWEIYKKYISLYEQTYLYGEPLAWILKDYLAKNLREDLKRLCKKTNKIAELETFFSILTAPTKKSFIIREEEDILRICQEIFNNQKYKNLFSKPLNEIKKELSQYPGLNKLIKEHVNKYSWIPYDYGVTTWSNEHFLTEIHKIIKKGDVDKRIKKLEDQSRYLKEKQQGIVHDLKMKSEFVIMFQAVQELTYLNDLKKEVFTKSHVQIRPVMEQMAKNLGLTWDLVSFLSPQEIEQSLLSGKLVVPVSTLRGRYQFSILHGEVSSGICLLEGDKAIELAQKIRKSPDQEKNEPKVLLKGSVASPGKTRGITKIVLSPADINKIHSGDILVTVMTSPDYVVGIRKASAIVTDEGGITCHAAIVSRELGIPCVTGTQTATKNLKDGDLIDVDANRGLIKVIQKAN